MRVIFICLGLWTGSAAFAQCTMTAEITQYDHTCGGFGVVWQITGGTPPYQVTLSDAYNGQFYSQTNISAAGNYGVGGGYTVGPMNLFVEDANACTASDQATTAPVSFPGYHFYFDTDCTAGLTTLFIELDDDFCEPGLVQYEIVQDLGGGGSAVFASGSIAADWTSVFTETWQYNQQLPQGRYTVDIVPVFNNCGFGGQCWGYPTEAPLDFYAVGAGDCGNNAFVRAALGGCSPTGPGIMRDDLRAAGLVPTTEPYSALGYSYVGGGAGTSIDPPWLAQSGPSAVVDWVVLEVRTSAAPYTLLRSKPAILLRDYQVFDTDGDPYINFGVLPLGTYRVVLRHRNHLGVMTYATGLDPQPLSPIIDFRSNPAMVPVGSVRPIFPGGGGCLWEGDVNGDGLLKYTGANNDRDPILLAIGGSTPTNMVTGQYSRADVNMDGNVKYTGAGNDRDPILNNVGGTTPTAVRAQAAP